MASTNDELIHEALHRGALRAAEREALTPPGDRPRLVQDAALAIKALDDRSADDSITAVSAAPYELLTAIEDLAANPWADTYFETDPDAPEVVGDPLIRADVLDAAAAALNYITAKTAPAPAVSPSATAGLPNPMSTPPPSSLLQRAQVSSHEPVFRSGPSFGSGVPR